MPDPPSSSNPERKHGFETNSEIPLHTTHDQDAFSLYSVATGDAKESRASSQYSKRRSDIAANTTKDGGIELNAVVRQVSSSTSVDGDPEGSEADINPTDDDETTYPGGLQLFILTLGLCLTTFTVALDNTIIATAIPRITTVFDSLGDVGWYGSSYLLTTTALQPSFGKIYQHFSVKTTYLLALVIFEVGSIICAAAQSSVVLIFGRAVSGAGASALFSGGLTMVGYSVPLKRRGLYIATLSSMFAVSSVVGPLLGGLFTDRVSWRWCFWINPFFGGVSFATVFVFFKNPKRKVSNLTLKQKILEIDLLGAFFLVCAIICLLLALQWGGSTYPWKDSKIWGCIIGFGLLIIIFIGLQIRRGDRATIPPRILGQRTILFSSLYSTFLSMGFNTHIFFTPLYFQAVRGTTAEGSGIRAIPYLGSSIVGSIISAVGTMWLGYYNPFMILAAAVFAIGSGLIYTFSVDSSAGEWVGYQLLGGFGVGLGIQIPFTAAQIILNENDMPTGNAMMIFFNSLGGALSISIAQNIFSNGLKNTIPQYAPNVSAHDILNAGATYLRKAVSPVDLPGVLVAYAKALDEAFVLPIAVAGVAMICACFVEWRSVKGKNLMAGAGA